MLRRSDFIAATYALSFVFANFGIAIAARMPMMTTTIRSSIRVNPFLFRDMYTLPPIERITFIFHPVDDWRECGATHICRYRRTFIIEFSGRTQALNFGHASWAKYSAPLARN